MARIKSTQQQPHSLNEQIRRLQLQIADERRLQLKQQQHFRHLLSDRLTSWPVLLGAIAAGVMLRQACTSTKVAVPPAAAANPEPTSELTTEASAATEPAPQSFWGTLLSLPLLTQSAWWLMLQLWHSNLFQELVRHKLTKSEQRHPPY